KSFFVDATDPDAGTTLTFSAIDLPEGATLDAATGEFRWTPGPGQAGDHVVILRADDGQALTRQT
ncbi:MAG: putative Ig domain-containing protein, partial [Rhodoferax sp.]|nr:putative Ig domain-containing protein [Rhodoferax sp.]